MNEPLMIVSIASFLVLYTVTVIGGATWLQTQFKNLKQEIIDDFDTKHKENAETVKALETLVMRHDFIINPEWRGNAANKQHHQ
jgi:hypothetical protein